MIDNFFWEYFTEQRKKMLHSCQRDTWYEGSLNGILGVKWTHEGPLMDIWTDTSARVSNDEIMLLQTTYNYKDNKDYKDEQGSNKKCFCLCWLTQLSNLDTKNESEPHYTLNFMCTL